MNNLYFCNFQPVCPAFYLADPNCRCKEGNVCKIYKNHLKRIDNEGMRKVQDEIKIQEELNMGDTGLLRFLHEKEML